MRNPSIRHLGLPVAMIFLVNQWKLLLMEGKLNMTKEIDDAPRIRIPKITTTITSSVSTTATASPRVTDSKSLEISTRVEKQEHIEKEEENVVDDEYMINFKRDIESRRKAWQELADKEVLEEPVEIYDGVVHVTKIHNPMMRKSINQMLCLNKAAYNHRRNYPWVIFHTMPIDEKDIQEAKAIAAPANVTFVRDSPPLEEVLKAMSKEEYDHLLGRCQCCKPPNNGCCRDIHRNLSIYWDWWCYEEKSGWTTLSYAWQAVFRSYNIWEHPALAPYKYMIWIDDDAMPTKSWLKDPMKPMVEEDLVIFYDNFPAGFAKYGILEKMQLAYNQTFCYIHRSEYFKGPQTGKFVVRPCKRNKKGNFKFDKVGLVHGMMHITNLDIYRKPIHLNFNRILTTHNTHRFSRQWDDQIAVTIPAAFEDPERAWDMRMHGYNMSIHHNGNLDGKEKNKRWNYLVWWKYYKNTFPIAKEMCDPYIRFKG